jgi:dTDP-4-amino-4,6-dideoxygalactose transaminase
MNAKMSEVHAAMGMAVLPHIPRLIEERKRVHEAYMRGLARLGLAYPTLPADANANHGYFPVIMPSAMVREAVHTGLARHNIHVRRYFYPSLNTLPYVSPVALPVSEDIADRVLCLPMFDSLTNADVARITHHIRTLIG